MKKQLLPNPEKMLELADINLAIFSEIDAALVSQNSQAIIDAFQKLVSVISPNNMDFQKTTEKYLSKYFISHHELPEEVFYLILESPLNDKAKENLFLSTHTNLLFKLALYRPEAFFLKLWKKFDIYKEARNKLALIPLKQTIISEISTEDYEIEGVPEHRLGVYFKKSHGLQIISGMTFLHILIHEKQNIILFTTLLLDILETEKDNVENLLFSYYESVSGRASWTGETVTYTATYLNSLLSLTLHDADIFSIIKLSDNLHSYKILLGFLLKNIIVKTIYSDFDGSWGAPTGLFEHDRPLVYDALRKAISNRFVIAKLQPCRDIGLLAMKYSSANTLSEEILNILLNFTNSETEERTEAEFLNEIITSLLKNRENGEFRQNLINYLESHYPIEAFSLNPWFQLEQKINTHSQRNANSEKIDIWFNRFYLERKNEGRISKRFLFANSFPKESSEFSRFFKNNEKEVIYNLINECISSDTIYFKAYSEHRENHTPGIFIRQNLGIDEVYSDACKLLKVAYSAAENCLSRIATPSNRAVAIAYKFSPVSREFKHQDGSNNAKKIIALAKTIPENTPSELESLSQTLFMLEKIIQESKDHGGFTSEASLNSNLINEYRKINTTLQNSSSEMVLEKLLYEVYDVQKNLAILTYKRQLSLS